MINAVIQNRTGTNLVVQMPCDGYQISCQLWERGIRISPSRLNVSDDNDGGVRVSLTADDPIGEQLISIFSPRHSLSDVNNVVNAVANARPEVRREMEQRILSGRYSTPDAVLRDARGVTQEMAPVKLSFYCPLKGQVNEWDGDMEDTCNGTLLAHQEKIEELLEEEQQPEDGDMAEYLVGDSPDLYTFLKANSAKDSRRTHVVGTVNADNRPLTKVACCGRCGAKLSHKANLAKRSSEYWYCQSKECGLSFKMPLAELEEAVTQILNQLIDDPMLSDSTGAQYTYEAECKNLHTVTDAEIKQAICDYLEIDSFDEDVVKEEIIRVEIGCDSIEFVTHMDRLFGMSM